MAMGFLPSTLRSKPRRLWRGTAPPCSLCALCALPTSQFQQPADAVHDIPELGVPSVTTTDPFALARRRANEQRDTAQPGCRLSLRPSLEWTRPMDARTPLDSLLNSTTWVRNPKDALGTLPEAALCAPPLLLVPNQRPDEEPVLPVLDMAPLADAVAGVLQSTGGEGFVPVESLDEAQVRSDPLVRALAEMFVGCAGQGLQRTAVPALATAWVSSRLLSGLDLGALELAPARREALTQLWQDLRSRPAAARGKALSTLAWELAGRLTAGFQLARATAPTLQDNALMRKVLTDPLVVSCARGTLDRSPDPELVGAVLGLPVEAGPLQHLPAVVEAVLGALEARRKKAKPGPMDFQLTEHLGDLREPGRILHRRDLGPLLLAGLPDLVTARDLKAAGVPSDVANQMLSRPGSLALAAAWRDLLTPLLAWDVASALVDRIVPLVETAEGDLRSASGTLRDPERLRLLVPRRASEAVVVASNLASLGRGLGSTSEAAHAWTRLCAHQKVPAHTVFADHGLAVFHTDSAAFAFTQKVRELLSGPRSATLASGERRVLDLTHVVSLGVARGTVEGGSDGARTWLAGPAVSQALSLCGSPTARPNDPTDRLSQRRAGPSGAGFANGGLVLSGSALHALIGTLRRGRAALHVQGDGTSVAGISADFQQYPVTAWWSHEGKVAVAISLVDPPDETTAAEVQVLDREDFDGFHRADQELRAEASDGSVRNRSSNRTPREDPFRATPPHSEGDPSPRASLGKVDSLFGFVTAPDTAPAPAASSPTRAPDAPPAPVPTAGGLLDAFTRPQEPEAAAPTGRLALAEEAEQPEAAGVGRLALLSEDDEDGPTAATDLGSGGPTVDIEDDDDDDDDEEEDEVEDSLVGEATLVEDYDDFVSNRVPELSILQEGFSSTTASETEDSTGFSFSDLSASGDMDDTPQAEAEPDGFSLAGDLPSTPSDHAAFGFRVADGDSVGGAGAGPAAHDPLLDELVRMFDGYVVIEENGSFTFGLPKAGLLRDAQEFQTQGDRKQAYGRFLQDKIRKGFITEAHKATGIPDGVRLEPLDGNLLREAYGEVAR